MQLLGSIIYVTSTFYRFAMGVYLVHWTHSFFVASSYRRFSDFARWDVI